MESKDNSEIAKAQADVQTTADPAHETYPTRESDPALDAGPAQGRQEQGSHQEHIREALELLYAHFPGAFIKEGDCKPLKVGILDDLKSRIQNIEGLSVSKVRSAVRVYTTRLRYFYAVREGAGRVDLDGNVVDTVSAEHALYARGRFSEINSKRRTASSARKEKAAQQRKGGRTEGDEQRRPRRRQDGRRMEKADPAQLRKGAFVFVSIERNFARGTVAEISGDNKAQITLQNGLSMSVPLNRLFVKKDPQQGRGQHRQGDFRGRGRRPSQGRGGRGATAGHAQQSPNAER